MENKYKIIISYIQDLSVEIPSPESLITIRNTTPEYRMAVDISTKPSKRNKSRPVEKNFIEGEYEDIEDKDGK